jgi:hypothetical protein
MALPSVFDASVVGQIVSRIDQLRPDTQPHWGKMSVAQMLAHCNVTYEMMYTTKHPKPGFFMRLMLKAFVKTAVTNEKGYPHNSRTAPAFLISDPREFEVEKKRLVDYLHQTLHHGKSYFEGKESNSFGPLTGVEWNNLMYKHLDHHLTQFGV